VKNNTRTLGIGLGVVAVLATLVARRRRSRNHC